MIGKILPDKRQKSLMVTYISPVASFEQKQQKEMSAETSGFKRKRESSVLDRLSDFRCEIVLTLRALRILIPS